jgi:hypothetical protein
MIDSDNSDPPEGGYSERVACLSSLIFLLFALFVVFWLPSKCARNVPAPKSADLTAPVIDSLDTATRSPEPVASAPPKATKAAPTTGQPVANANANLRAGPGTSFAVIGSAKAGQPLKLVAKNPAGDWLQLDTGAWIFGRLVAAAPDLPVAEDIPTLPSPTNTPGP